MTANETTLQELRRTYAGAKFWTQERLSAKLRASLRKLHLVRPRYPPLTPERLEEARRKAAEYGLAETRILASCQASHLHSPGEKREPPKTLDFAPHPDAPDADPVLPYPAGHRLYPVHPYLVYLMFSGTKIANKTDKEFKMQMGCQRG